jgi:hypothetical protein
MRRPSDVYSDPYREIAMRGPKLSDERGIALAVAIFALVIIGALVGGTFFAGKLEQRGGLNSAFAAEAFEAAEAGVQTTIVAWDPAVAGAGAVGADVALGTTVLGGTASYTVTATKLNDAVYLVRSEGRRNGPGGVLARRLIGTLVRTHATDVDIQAAVTGRGTIRVGGNATVDGNDHIPAAPANWGGVCPATGPAVGGVRTDQNVVLNGGPDVFGNPALDEHDAGVTDSIFTTPFNALVPMADVVITNGNPAATGPSTTGAPLRCNKANSLNWGEPWYPASPASASVCQSWFPIIYRPGDLKLQGGRGQGILLVDGDLDMSGGVEFFGIVIVNGRLKTTGNGNKINGAVMARNVDLDDNFIGGTPVVNYSSCAISRALQASAVVIPLNSRAWAQLY